MGTKIKKTGVSEDIYTAEDVFDLYPKEVKSFLKKVYSVVKKSLPGLTEKAYMGWRSVGFFLPNGKHIAGLWAVKSGVVRLNFARGEMLTDPHDLLHKTKFHCYLEIASPAAINEQLITAFLLEALELQEDS